MKKIATLSALFMSVPFFAFAQNFTAILNTFSNIVNSLIPLLMAIALLAFFWGVVKYIWNGGDAESEKSGRSIMVAGIVGLFVMVAIWGIVGIIANTFGVGTGQKVNPPGVNRTY